MSAVLRAPVVLVEGRAELFTLASLLLQYPDAELLAAAGELVEAARALPEEVGRDGVLALAEELRDGRAVDLQRRYVETFDLRRRSSLDLTYYLHGDTRKRGIALLALKQRYRAAGFTVSERVLPDFLPVVLEFAAAVGPRAGEAPLRQHRPGLGLLAESLRTGGSPYAAVVDAVCSVLPPLSDAGRAEVAAVAATGPTEELVGLDPYGAEPVGLDPYGTDDPYRLDDADDPFAADPFAAAPLGAAPLALLAATSPAPVGARPGRSCS